MTLPRYLTRKKIIRKLSKFLFAAACITSVTAVSAEYTQYSLLDFENPEGMDLPNKIKHGHNSTPFTTTVTDYARPDLEGILDLNNLPAVLGSKGLSFEPLEKEPHLSVVYNMVLNRDRLGAQGAALFEADFFLTHQVNHTVAILASAYDENYGNSSGYRFYRFGIQGDRVYFSFTDNTPSPVIYHRQDLADFGLAKPGWHRLQMSMHSDGNLYCYIDGIQTNFSPISETTLNAISPGLMVTRYNNSSGKILCDNVRVSWTQDATAPLPPTPWGNSTGGENAASIEWDRTGLVWHTTMSSAWQASKESNKPILVYAHDNQLEPTESGLKLLESPDASALIEHVELLRLNSIQQDSQVILSRLSINQYPSLTVVKPDGTPFSRVNLAEVSDWQSIQTILTGK